MSNNQKDSSPLLEDERIQKELSKRFRSSRYWTLKKGIDFFLPREEDGSRFPFWGAFKAHTFKIIKEDIDIQLLKTINSKEEIKEILAYDPVAELEKIISQRSPKRKVEMQWRNLKRYGSFDKEIKLSFYEIQDEKIKFFCSKIKIKPEILICYIIDHIDLFSPEVEIPPKLRDWLSTVRKSDTMENKNVIKPTKEGVEELLAKVGPESELKPIDIPTNHIDFDDDAKLDHLIKKVTPEINLLYEEIKRIAKKDRRKTQDLRYQDGKAAFEKLENKLQEIEFHDLNPDNFANGKPYRAIKGGLLRKVVIRTMPKLIGNKKDIKIDGQALYKRMTDLKKTS